MNLTKEVFQKKVKGIIELGFKPRFQTENKTLILSFRNKFDELVWETVCYASTYDVLNRQEKKYLAWFNEVIA